ncbi:hypothetical protein CDCA_CDCA01G0252 [Cyanidium caldarium]|uniref:Uncharacterized protein n=1 Tax=Cyanidium caldarium TaxID=2771 RepID=A0AAV9IPN6_CYACA|nr:hypothetical protein CDCA_CDCA01G0252 [Cyanidium caldarium]
MTSPRTELGDSGGGGGGGGRLDVGGRAVESRRWGSFEALRHGLPELLPEPRAARDVSLRTLNVCWRRTSGDQRAVRRAVERAVRATGRLRWDEALLRAVLFPELDGRALPSLHGKVVERVAQRVGNGDLTLPERLDGEQLLQRQRREGVAAALQQVDAVAAERSRQPDGFAATGPPEVPAAAAPQQRFFPNVSDEVMALVPPSVLLRLRNRLPQPWTALFNDELMLQVVNMESHGSMLSLLTAVHRNWLRRQRVLLRHHDARTALSILLRETCYSASRRKAVMPGDGFHTRERLQYFRPRPVRDEEWQRWCRVLDQDFDGWLRVACQKLDPAKEVTDEALAAYCERLTTAFMAGGGAALSSETSTPAAMVSPAEMPSSTAMAALVGTAYLREEGNIAAMVSVTAPGADAARLAEERTRFPQDVPIVDRAPLDTSAAVALLSSAPVLFVLLPAAETTDAARADFRRLCRELLASQQAARASIHQAARMLLIVPPREGILQALPSLRRHLPRTDALLACRVRTDAGM